MTVNAEGLRDLHHLHQRARALRDRIHAGPKALAARQLVVAQRRAEFEAARKALQDAKMHLKQHEHALQGAETRIDDLKVKLNQVKKNEEYKALQNQIAHDQAAKAKHEEDVLRALEAIERETEALARLDADAKRAESELDEQRAKIEEHAAAHRAQLGELETAIARAEEAIPAAERDRYRRIVGRYGADALAACEDNACLGCFTSLTPQMVNDLINGQSLVFCLSCGRLLYLAEAEAAAQR